MQCAILVNGKARPERTARCYSTCLPPLVQHPTVLAELQPATTMGEDAHSAVGQSNQRGPARADGFNSLPSPLRWHCLRCRRIGDIHCGVVRTAVAPSGIRSIRCRHPDNLHDILFGSVRHAVLDGEVGLVVVGRVANLHPWRRLLQPCGQASKALSCSTIARKPLVELQGSRKRSCHELLRPQVGSQLLHCCALLPLQHRRRPLPASRHCRDSSPSRQQQRESK
jgi:hypothetical protein